MKLAIAVPTYNESGNIKKLLLAIKQSVEDYPSLKCTVFVIDDNSPDGTGKIARDAGAKLKTNTFKVQVLSRDKKEGLGKAYIFAFREILPQGFDFILQMDADLSHDPLFIPLFLDAAKEADLVIGSRYIEGGSIPDWSLSRKIQSKGGNLYTRVFLGSRITDYTGGFNMYSGSLLHQIDLNRLQTVGYGFLIELKYNALQSSKKVVEIPIIFMERHQGKSKIPSDTILKNLLLVLQIKFLK